MTEMSKKQIPLVEEEVFEMLEKGVIQKVVPNQGKFLSNLFLVGRRDGGNHPAINLKNLNKFNPYEHFEMECLRFLLDQDGLLCKIDLRETHFSVLLNKNLQNFVLNFNGQASYTNFFAHVLDLGQL